QGLSDLPQLQFPLFVAFVLVYTTIVLSNLVIFVSVICCSHLHTPMYMFLCNLSVLDISYTSTILPKLLVMLFTQCKTISFVECMIQVYFFMFFVCTEVLVLSAMAYDRYIAICFPLSYFHFMSPNHCTTLIVAVWIIGLIEPLLHTVFICNSTYCSSHHIDHFFCDVSPLMKLSCSYTLIIEIWTYILGFLIGICMFTFIVISYVFIISAILNIKSAGGRHKAFSTCASHMTCVIIFYGTMFCLYIKPTSMYSPRQDKFYALLYVILIPLLNPLIYTLKNKDFKQ
ncbi:olfactory receptor 1019-like, partial [Pelobates cultripes]